MSRSGVAVSDDCIAKFNELKLGKNIKYIIYALNDKKTEIVVLKDSSEDNLSDSSEQDLYQQFLENLPDNQCRYAVYDFAYELAAGEGKRNKICFLAWVPDEAPVKSKMVFASSKESLRRALTGIAVEIQGTDYSEVAYEAVLEKVAHRR